MYVSQRAVRRGEVYWCATVEMNDEDGSLYQGK